MARGKRLRRPGFGFRGEGGMEMGVGLPLEEMIYESTTSPFVIKIRMRVRVRVRA